MQQKILIRGIGTLMVLVSLLCMFTPKIMGLQWLQHYTVHIMLSFLGFGLLLLALQKPKLMFVSMGCCAALCVYLKSNTGVDFKRPKRTNAPVVKVAHINLSSTGNDVESLLTMLKTTDADVISFQEMTPHWDNALRDTLKREYPYQLKHLGFSIDGLALYSRYRLYEKDTIYCGEAPIISASVEVDSFYRSKVVSSYISPPLYTAAFNDMNAQLDSLRSVIGQSEIPCILLGDFNLVAWAAEMSQFRYDTKLNDSRMGYVPSYQNGHLQLFDVPIDHILYSISGMRCLDFETMSTSTVSHLGIAGLYQFRTYLHRENAYK